MATPVGRPPASAATIRAVLLVGLGWLLLAIALGAGGVMRMLAPAAAPVVLMGLTAIVLTTAVRRGAVREWLWRLDERCLVAIHLTRFVGAYFLFLYMRGQLPYAFAVPATQNRPRPAASKTLTPAWMRSTWGCRKKTRRAASSGVTK